MCLTYNVPLVGIKRSDWLQECTVWKVLKNVKVCGSLLRLPQIYHLLVYMNHQARVKIFFLEFKRERAPMVFVSLHSEEQLYQYSRKKGKTNFCQHTKEGIITWMF